MVRNKTQIKGEYNLEINFKNPTEKNLSTPQKSKMKKYLSNSQSHTHTHPNKHTLKRPHPHTHTRTRNGRRVATSHSLASALSTILISTYFHRDGGQIFPTFIAEYGLTRYIKRYRDGRFLVPKSWHRCNSIPHEASFRIMYCNGFLAYRKGTFHRFKRKIRIFLLKNCHISPWEYL